jgi:magnesium-transporting ATPase (P-type)
VLADDNFLSIALAVRQGRTTYANLKKAILFILPTNVAEGLVILIALALGSLLPMPITPVQILWVNMVTAVTLGLALAFEPAEPIVMKKPPRTRNTAILDGYLTWRVFFVSALMGLGVLLLFWMHHKTGANIALSRTVAVNALVVAEAFYLLNCRYIHYPVLGKGFFGNPVVFVAIAVLAVFQIAFTYWPVFNNLFGTTPLNFTHWSWIFALGAAVFVCVELEKIATNKLSKK